MDDNFERIQRQMILRLQKTARFLNDNHLYALNYDVTDPQNQE